MTEPPRIRFLVVNSEPRHALQSAEELIADLARHRIPIVSLQWRSHPPVLVDAAEAVADLMEVLLNVEQRRLPFGTIHLGQGVLDVRLTEATNGWAVTERVVSIEGGIRTESTAHWTCPRGVLVSCLRNVLGQFADLCKASA